MLGLHVFHIRMHNVVFRMHHVLGCTCFVCVMCWVARVSYVSCVGLHVFRMRMHNVVVCMPQVLGG